MRGKAAVSMETALDRQVTALDELVGEVRSGIRDQRHFDALEERAQAISAGVLAPFRKRARA